MGIGAATSGRPSTGRQSAWRYALAALLGIGVWLEALQNQYVDVDPTLPALDLLVGTGAVGLLRWRRRHPPAVALVLNSLTALSGASAGAALLATVSVATRRRWREIVPVATIACLAQLHYAHLQAGGGDFLGSAVLGLVTQTAVVAAGMYLGARRDLAAARAEQLLQAQREHALQLSEARAAERSRIAREMHDVLAHRLSLVAMYAGVLSYRRGLTEQQVSDTADVIRETTHSALADLREVLGVLRADGHELADRPQPTLSDVPALVEEAVAAGSSVRLHNHVGDLAHAPDTVGRNAYRMVQEALTNARKHAPDSTVDVVLRGCRGAALEVEVRNPVHADPSAAAAPGSGLGLVGLTERATALGGGLHHGTHDGDFVLSARLPWPA